jgi:hypothetical protein
MLPVCRYVSAHRMGQFLRNRRLGRRRPDRIAVRRYDARCRESSTACGGGRRRICHADNHSLQHRVAFVDTPTSSMAIDHSRRSSLRPYRPLRGSIRAHRNWADSSANRIPTGVRGLAISRSATSGGVRDARAIGIRGSLPHARSPVWRRSRGALVTLHRHPQRMGQHRLPCIREQARHRHRAALREYGAAFY